MRSLRDALFALDGDGSPRSLLEAVEGGMWPPLRRKSGNLLSLDELCRRFSGAGRALRSLADDEANVWTHVTRRAVIDELRERIRNPGVISQRPTDLCGPISLLMEFARRRPADYVRATAELLREGVFTAQSGRTFTAAEDLRGRPVPNGEIRGADWLFAATMRDSQNITDDIDDAEGLEGLTMPLELEDWLEDVLGLKGEYYPCWFEDEMEALAFGQAAVAAGGVAFLLIDNGLVHEAADNTEEDVWLRKRRFAGGGIDDWSPRVHCEDDSYVYPNHYVVLLKSEVGFPGDTELRVRLWSFGSDYEITGTGEGFSEYLYTVITGTP